jgi:hypothetical protein
MHQRAGVKLHQDGMPKASIRGLLLATNRMRSVLPHGECYPGSSVASPPMFPLPH